MKVFSRIAQGVFALALICGIAVIASNPLPLYAQSIVWLSRIQAGLAPAGNYLAGFASTGAPVFRTFPSVSVIDMGSTCNGVATDTTTLQNTLDAFAGSGVELVIPAGANCKASGLTWSSSKALKLRGASPSSYMTMAATSGNLLAATAGSVTVDTMTVLHPTPGAVSSGFFFSFVGAEGKLKDITFYNGFSLAYWGAAATGSAHDIYAQGMSSDGFDVDVSPTFLGQQYGQIMFSKLRFQGTSSNGGSGLYLVSGDTITVSDSNIAGFKIGINATTSASRSYLANLYFSNVLVDGAGGPATTTAGWLFDGTNQFLGRVDVSNSWSASMSAANGFYTKNASTITLSGVTIINNGAHGVLADTGTIDLRITGGSTIAGNSQSSSGNYSGVYVLAGANKIYINHNQIAPTQIFSVAGVYPNTQKYGVEIADAGTTNYSVTHNVLAGNVTGTLRDAGGGTEGLNKFTWPNTTGSANYGASLAISGGALGLNLANANTFTGLQGLGITGADAFYTINDVSGGHWAATNYQAAGVTAWRTGRVSSGNYQVYDIAGSQAVIDAVPNSDLYLTPKSGLTRLFKLLSTGTVTSPQFLATVAEPAASTCGTGPSVDAGSSAHAGKFTIGTGATACTITFSVAYPTNGYCTVTPAAQPAAVANIPYISAQSRTAFTVSGGTASAAYYYTCGGN